jgi:hypothetical protein
MNEKVEAVAKLMRIHYDHFMSRREFWYDEALREADAIVCIAASNLRREATEFPNTENHNSHA